MIHLVSEGIVLCGDEASDDADTSFFVLFGYHSCNISFHVDSDDCFFFSCERFAGLSITQIFLIRPYTLVELPSFAYEELDRVSVMSPQLSLRSESFYPCVASYHNTKRCCDPSIDFKAH